MIKALVALAGLALVLPSPATSPADAAPPKSAKSSPAKKKALKARAPVPPVEFPELSIPSQRVMAWVAESGDHNGLPYVVIDKPAAAIYAFDATGKPVGFGPVLIGRALGDDATPGVGSKSLAEIGPAEKTTPAGRYLAKFGLAAGHNKVLWVDYATSVAMHTIPTGNPRENRAKRMLSPSIDDNRITFGCINVPKALYNGKIAPMFGKKGGYVYILPDVKPLEDAFPPLHARPFNSAAASEVPSAR
ncbi:L,D-transpeptidase [Novosphingobium taihuense]|uniref:L,D-transpeptidase-like protein n=1 Tax=Novosphingobium taihuense TaxID=260085 RepID=A0A7W7A8G8_9SPHN|nr:L,D-transpeptidase [Novosphingobium taihuense]MBB4612368.1 hypothetical protein [Novosphingobium taihuense]TWH88279.1 hypothetical protein IQ25_00395 [Novosphingobium taihuense]